MGGEAVDRPPLAATPIADAYRDTAKRIIDAALASDGAWEKLAHLTDRIGHRLSGSPGLEKAVKWAAATMRAEGHEEVRTEKVMVPHWVRGDEAGAIISPIERPMRVLALGGSVGTPKKGLTAEVVVVGSIDELEKVKDSVKGKWVLFNKVMPAYGPEGSHYGTTVRVRNHGAAAAAKHGAVGALVRSVTARSFRSPHTGMTRYEEGGRKIPAVAISTEDADLIARLAGGEEPVKVKMKLGAKTLPDAESANVVAELRGRELPDEVVVIGCHLDSWDVGHGAHDDGGGCVIVMHTLTILRELELRPRRTIRVVLYTNEENGLAGAKAYYEKYKDALEGHVAAIEADSGTFKPRGFGVSVDGDGLDKARDIVTLLEPLGATEIRDGGGGADIGFLRAGGVPLMGLWVEGSRYFDYHHSEADTLDKVDPRDLKECVATMAVMAYVLADMEGRIGRYPKEEEK